MSSSCVTLAEVLWAKGSPLEEEEIWALLYLAAVQLLEDIHKGEVSYMKYVLIVLTIGNTFLSYFSFFELWGFFGFVFLVFFKLVYFSLKIKSSNGNNSMFQIKMRNLSVLLGLYADCSAYKRDLNTVGLFCGGGVWVLLVLGFPPPKISHQILIHLSTTIHCGTGQQNPS